MVLVQEIADQFRAYDQALVDWLRATPTSSDGKQIPIVFATPDRAFAAMHRLLHPQTPPGEMDPRNIPLPFISISRGRIMFDPMRFRGTNTKIRSLATSEDKKTVYQAKFPLPYDISYDIQVWAKNRETLNAYELWMMLMFESYEVFIPVDFSVGFWGWNKKVIPFENEGIVDNSDLEPAEDHRVLRFTQVLTGKGWIIGDVSRVKAVEKIWLDTHMVVGNVDLDGVTTSQVDSDPVTFPKVNRVVYDENGETVEP